MQKIDAIFNQNPEIQTVTLSNGNQCFVVENALNDPDYCVAFAIENSTNFKNSGKNKFPGIEYSMPGNFYNQLRDFFILHIRDKLNGRRLEKGACRLSMVTLDESELMPAQTFCHQDEIGISASQNISASVLYLFNDESLGGTSFFAPKVSEEKIKQLVTDSLVLSSDDFLATHQLMPKYMCNSNQYFEKIGAIGAKWNRMIFYDGHIYHTGDIRHPEKLSKDPKIARLTLNSFFLSTKKAK